MNMYVAVGLVVFVVIVAVVFVRYVNATVDREFRSLARAVADDQYRVGELKRVDALLDASLPLPAEVKPVAGPSSFGRGAIAPLLLAVGVILTWGGLSAHEGRTTWFYGGLACAGLACVIMLVTLRRRKWERVARLLRFRADLRRLDNNRKAAASDLQQLIRLTPWDDAAWAELSDDLAGEGEMEPALDAIRHAARLDPGYDEYRMLEASLAIRMGKLDLARDAVKAWAALDGVGEDDPRLVMYQAAIQLAEGDRDGAAARLRGILTDRDQPMEFLDTDQALAGIKDMLPGPAGPVKMEDES